MCRLTFTARNRERERGSCKKMKKLCESEKGKFTARTPAFLAVSCRKRKKIRQPKDWQSPIHGRLKRKDSLADLGDQVCRRRGRPIRPRQWCAWSSRCRFGGSAS